MSVLGNRTTRRFAVRSSAKLKPGRGKSAAGLLIELSLDGCRISNVDHARFCVGELARIELDGFEPLDALVRWSQDGFVGLRFARSLSMAGLESLLQSCRPQAAAAA
jgi:hypothetical protein